MADPIASDRLLDLVDYDPLTGIIVWNGNAGAQVSGTSALSVGPRGYLRVRFEGKNYSAHRVAYAKAHGKWPELAIDHANGVRNDNRLCNLREATQKQNCWNRRRMGSLPKGVTRDRNGNYQAQIKHDQRNIYLGAFPTPELAGAAYVAKATELFGEFARFE